MLRLTDQTGGRFFLLLVGACLLAACASQPPTTAPVVSSEEAAGLVYVVRPGDALSVIALQHGESYRNIARWNNLSPPYTIRPGQRLRLTPPATMEQNPNAAGNQEPQPPQEAHVRPENDAQARSHNPHPAETSAADTETPRHEGKLHWQWPAPGRILRRFSQSNKGLDIGGREGDPVYAAASGTVVYSGTGVIGYGPLVILRHNNTYLSAYAHNQQLLVKEGESVTAGQQIAAMGMNQRHHALLHFEIRRNSKSVDPLRYLPDRE